MYRIYERDRKLGPPTFNEVISMADREEENNTTQLIYDALNEGEPFEKIIQLTELSEKYVQINGRPVLNEADEIVGLEGTVKDVTNLKVSELSLRETNKQLRDISDNLDGVLLQYLLFPDGSDKINFISRGSEQIFGVKPEQAIADNSVIWDGVHNDDVEGFRESIQNSADSLSPFGYKWRHYMADGSMKYLDV